MEKEVNVFLPKTKINIEVKDFWKKLLALSFIFAITTLIVIFSSSANEINTTVFNWINQGFPTALGESIAAFMEIGSFWGVLLIGLAYLSLHRWRLASTTILAELVSLTSVHLLKTFIDFRRPFLVLDDVRIRTTIDMAVTDLNLNVNGYPSGHTSAITLITAIAWPHVTKPVRGLLVIAIALTGFGRVYTGVHFPLDVVGGVFHGLIIGIIARQVSLKYQS